jgi:predicted transcriptional regulator
MLKVAQVEGRNSTGQGVDFAPWHNFQRWLEAGDRKVDVPFAECLATLIPPKSVRLRRDIGQVLRAIKAHALLHRDHREKDDAGCIVADIHNDYAIVRELTNDLLAETSEVKIRDKDLQTIDAVTTAVGSDVQEDGATVKAVAKELKLDRSATHRRLWAAVDAGFIVNLETRKGRPGRYQLTGESVDVEDMLPSPEMLEKHMRAQWGPKTVHTCTPSEYIVEIQGDKMCKPPCTSPTQANGGARGVQALVHTLNHWETTENNEGVQVCRYSGGDRACVHCGQSAADDPNAVPAEGDGWLHDGCYDAHFGFRRGK